MSLMKRVDQARDAYRKGDVGSSAAAHSAVRIAASAREEHGGASHAYLGDMVYGGLDGIVTTFAVVSGVAGAQLGSGIVLILGLANLFADGFSMAVGAYLSSKSEQEYYDREYTREAWEVEHFRTANAGSSSRPTAPRVIPTRTPPGWWTSRPSSRTCGSRR